MIRASIAAFSGSYFSVFHAPRMDLFWAILLPVLLWLIVRHKHYSRMLFITLFFFVWTQSAVQLQLESRYNVAKKTTLTLLLEVIQLPIHGEKSTSFMARPVRIIASDNAFDYMKLRKIKINWYQPTQLLKGGQIWRMSIRLQPPYGYQNGAGFDYERWMFAEGISATAYVLNQNQPVYMGESSNVVLKARVWLSEKIRHYAQGLHYLALFQTLSIGDKTLLSPELKRLFINTGTAHLLVISGLHIGLFSLMFYFLAGRFWLVLNARFKTRLNQTDFAIVWAWGAAFVYAALAGFSLPTVRALIMLSFLYLVLLRRHNDRFLNVFCAALVLVLLWQPLALLSFSFWLSFLAVLLIVLVQYGLKNQSKIKAVLMLQLLFAVLFIPLNAIVFQQLIVSGFLANLLLIPVMSFVVIPLSLLGAFLAAMDWAGTTFLYQSLDYILGLSVTYLRGLQMVFGEPVALSSKHVGLMLVSALGALLLFSFWRLPLRLPALMLMLMPWFYTQEMMEKGAIKVYFFDVGMGTAVLLQTQQHTLLFDVGPGNKKRYQPAKWVIAPYLQSQGITQVDKTVLSHSDKDHYGGIWPLADQGLVSKTVYTGSQKNMQGLLGNEFTLLNCHQTRPWHWDGVDFEFLALRSQALQGDNNQSCVLLVRGAKGSVLLMGDVEHQREEELLSLYREQLNVDVMLVPHHGSKTSSSFALLEAVQPRYSVVTAGFLNRWGLPKTEVMKRYDNQNIRWFNTAVEGSVGIYLSEKGVDVKTFRRENNELWYAVF